jgi:23S rRNA (uracil1939-C5)-methyltransferase
VCSKKAELVILDPPRTGNALIAKKLAAGSAHTIIYISCNPKTLKRDMKILNDGGFNLIDIEGFDMFPQTPHIEVMAMMAR